MDKEIGRDSLPILLDWLGSQQCEEMAKETIDVAHHSGFDAVKFQSFKSENRSASCKTSKYVEKVAGIEETDFEIFGN